MSNDSYHHKQIGWTILIFIAVFLTVLGFILLPGEGNILYLTVWFVLMVVAILFNTLTIHIQGSDLHWYFGPGFWKKHILLQDIVATEVVRNKWYYGWGVRRIPDGWLYNVSGLEALQLTLANGDIIRLGSNQPAVLKEVIEQRQRMLHTAATQPQ